MQELRQSTGVDIRIGPAMDATDGVTPETGLALGTADQVELLKHDGAATVDISGRTFAAVTGCNGWYDLTFTATDTDTLGMMTVVIQDSSLMAPIFTHFMVVSQEYYDAKYGTGSVSANLTGYGGADFETGTIQTGSDTAPVLAAGATSNDISGSWIFFTGGTGAGQGAMIDAYNTSTKVATLNKTLTTAVSTDSTYIIIPFNFSVVSEENPAPSTNPGILQTTTIAALTNQTVFTLTAGSSDDDAYNGQIAVIVDQTTGTQKAVGSVSDYTGATRQITLSADPGIFTMADGDTIHIMAATGAAGSAPTVAQIADGVWDEPRAGHTTAGTYGETLATVETNIDNLDDAISNVPTAAENRAEMDSNSTMLAVIAGYIDTEITALQNDVTAILADSNELQTDLTDGGRLDLLIDSIKAKTDQMIFTVANVIDANIQNINDVAITGNGQSGTEFSV